MSLLTPLYIVGLLAVSLPLVFHLIRRLPRGQFSFSSLMFVRPSPPRLTRKSRLDNLLLLLFRALALILVALAFSRPFWRETALSGVDEVGIRRSAILVDTSASMRRGNLWQQAVARVHEVLDQLGPGDDVGLFAFDSDLRDLVKFSDSAPAGPQEQADRVRAALQGLAPTWAASDLGQALIGTAEELHQTGSAKHADAELIRQIVLISDLQQGCRIDSLQAYEWPRDVRLALHTVVPARPTNGGLHLAPDRSDQSEQDGEEEIRVQVTNDRDSRAEQFELHWAGQGDGGQGKADGGQQIETPQSGPPPSAFRLPPSINVYVPPGESRIVRVPRWANHPEADRLILTGDDHPFDNTLYLAPLRQREVYVLYLGTEEGRDAEGMRYYLQLAFPQTARRKVNLLAHKPEQPLSAEDLSAARLIVVTEAVPDERVAQLKRYLEGGGTVFYVLRDAAAGKVLANLMGQQDLLVEEARTADYAMFGEIAFGHPLFVPFADPRLNNFTKIHFWRHRRVGVQGVPGVEVLARFDDGDPAWFEQVQKKGRLLVLTSGWHPADSELARSTKFVPLMCGVLERAGVAEVVLPQYLVGDPVELAIADQRPTGAPTNGGSRSEALVAVPSMVAVVRKPDGSDVRLADDVRTFTEADQPGVYHLSLVLPSAGHVDASPRDGRVWYPRTPPIAGREEAFAVNVSAAESSTAPLEVEQLEQFGVRLGDRPTRLELAEQRRQMRDLELEGKQRLWRRLIVAALGVLIVETWLAGYLARRTEQPPEVTG
jgi:hypothetical protein